MTNTEIEFKKTFQESSLLYHFKPSLHSFLGLVVTLILLTFAIRFFLIISSFIGNIRWLYQYAIYLIPLLWVVGIGYYFVFYKNLNIIMNVTSVTRNSLFSSKKINYENITKLKLYNNEYPLAMPQIFPDWLVLRRSFLKIISEDKSLYLSDNMIGFDEFVYNIRLLSKKPFESVTETEWLAIFKF